jgi:3-hydroxyacyl-CoA dehydrogenase
MGLKREVFATLDALCKPDAVLATTTSYLDVEELARATKRPEQVLGMHFPSSNPAVRLVETARTPVTAKAAWARALHAGRTLGKVAVSVLARPGLVGDRMFSVLLREALFLLEEGALPEDVDRVLYDFGFPLGPFAAADRDGLERLATHGALGRARLSERERACDILERICARGRCGSATAAGFYRYDQRGTRTPDPEVAELVVEHSKKRGIARRTIPSDELLARCLYALINEGARILEEGVAARPLDIDMIWIHGYGFPAHHGGPMFHADELGLGRVHRDILDFQQRLQTASWVPAPLLERLSKSGSGFYGAR